MNFFFGDWKMFDAAWDDHKLTLFNSDVAIPELHQQAAF
jgi:hypothetical protein